jgi:hypothetical protein
VFTRVTLLLFPRIILGRVVPMSHQATSRAGIAICPVIGQRVVPILTRRPIKEMSVRGEFTILPLKKFLLVR